MKPLVDANNEQEALELLAKSRSSGLDREEPHYLLGVIYYGLGRKGDAMRMLGLARKQVPDSARIAAYLGLVELSAGQTGAAEGSFRSALALDSGEVLALTGIGEIRYRQKRWAEAAEYFEKSRTGDPGALFLLCDAYFRVHRTDDAMLTAEVIRALASDRKDLLKSLDELVTLNKSSQPSLAPN